MEQRSPISDQMQARLKNSPEGFPRRRLFIFPLVILIHIGFFIILFGTRSGLINIKAPEFAIIQVDVVPNLTRKRPVKEIDERQSVNPNNVSPKKLETVKKDSEVQPKPLTEPLPESLTEPAAKEIELADLTPAPEKNLSPEPLSTSRPTSSLSNADVLSQPSPSRNSLEIDLKAGLDSIVLECLKSLNFSEKPQPCHRPFADYSRNNAHPEFCRIKIDVMIDGTVENLVVTDCPNQGLIEVTRETLKDWRFIPAVINGKKVIKRRHGVRIIICGIEVQNNEEFAEDCRPKSLLSPDLLNEPVKLGAPRPLDKETLEQLEGVKAFLNQSDSLQDDKQNQVETPPKKKLSLDDILK